MTDPTTDLVPRRARLVLLAVFDGLRPDMVTPSLTPNILRVASGGHWFRAARSVFPPVTRVCTTSIATGAPPAVHGIVGNKFFHPDAFADRVFDTSDPAHIRRAEEVHGGRFVQPDTFGDVMAAAGQRLAVVHTGSAGSAHLINPRAKAGGHWTFSVHGEGATQTPEAVAAVTARFGPLPPRQMPRLPDADYAARVMRDFVLPEMRPDAAVIWFNEPDTTYHFRGLGSQDAALAIRNADAAFGTILDWIEAQADREDIAVIAASDHGQISTDGAWALADDLRDAGFDVGEGAELDGRAFVMTGGRSGEVRALSASREETARLGAWLLAHEDVSHVFSRDDRPVEGTLPLSAVDLMHERAPDLFYVLRADGRADRDGLPGLGLMTVGDVAVGGGQHGGLQQGELNNVFIVRAPELEPGGLSEAPAGLFDLGPTILSLLGLGKAPTMVGRDVTRPAREEPRRRRIEGPGGQAVAVVEQDGRRFMTGA